MNYKKPLQLVLCLKVFMLFFISNIFSSSPKEISDFRKKLSKEKKGNYNYYFYALRLGRDYFTVNLDSSNYFVKNAINETKEKGFFDLHGYALGLNAVCFYLDQNVDSSLFFLDKALETLDTLENKRFKLEVMSFGGTIFNNIANYQKAEEYFKAVENHDSIVNYPKIHSDALVSIAYINSIQGNFDESRANLKKAFLISDTFKDDRRKGLVYTGMALNLRAENKTDSAIYFYQKSLAIFDSAQTLGMKAASLINIAMLQNQKNDYTNAMTNFYMAIEIAAEINDNKKLVVGYNNLASLYYNLQDYENALELYNKAADLSKQTVPMVHYTALLNIGNIHQEKGDYEKSIANFTEAYSFFVERNVIEQQVACLIALSNSYLAINDIETAKNKINQAEKLLPKSPVQSSMEDIFATQSQIYLKQNNIQASKEKALKAKALISGESTYKFAKNISSILSDIYEKEGRLDSVVYFQKLINAYQDSISNDNIAKTIGRTEAEFEFKNLNKQLKAENELKLLEKEIQISNQRFILFVFAASLLLLSLVVIFLYRIKSSREKSNALLIQKQKEIQEANDNLKKLNEQKNKLFSIVAHDLKSPLLSLGMIIDLALKKELTKAEIQDLLQKSRVSLEGVQQLSENLLQWASSAINGYEVKKEHLTLYNQVDYLFSLFAPFIKTKNLKVFNHTPKDYTVYLDKNTLNLILRNLISNAIKFCNENDTIRVYCLEDENFTYISVADSGVGMDKETSKKLFKQISADSKLGTNQEKGSGIGLMLCKSFILENGGDIFVEKSEKNQGTIITFKFPKQA
jgi:signal transduction histidine kinase